MRPRPWDAPRLDGLTPIATARVAPSPDGRTAAVIETIRWRPSRLVEDPKHRRYGWVERL